MFLTYASIFAAVLGLFAALFSGVPPVTIVNYVFALPLFLALAFAVFMFALAVLSGLIGKLFS